MIDQLPADLTDYSLRQNMSFVPNEEHAGFSLWTGGRKQTQILEIEVRLVDWYADGYWCKQEIRFQVNGLQRVRQSKKNDYMKWLRHLVAQQAVQAIEQAGLLAWLIRPEITRSNHTLTLSLYWRPDSLVLDNHHDLTKQIVQETKEVIFSMTAAGPDEEKVDMEPVEAAFIRRALEQARGNRRTAALALKISLHSLVSRIHRFQIT